MNRRTYLHCICAALIVAGLSVGCDKSIDVQPLTPYVPTSTDSHPERWKTYVLGAADEIAVPPPDAVGSDQYSAELNSLKNLQPNGQQSQAIEYWGAGTVIRWNEIALQLSADYNIPPNYDANGKYPVPDPKNPKQTPRYPFATPPYVARGLALLSVAQYDGLVAAAHYQKLYNRTAPYNVKDGSQPRLPAIDRPSYPSAEAVCAYASCEILAYLFPGEVEFLEQKAEECRNSRLWAGMNLGSDLAAGENLGKAIAQKIIEQAKSDGIAQANNQAGFPKQIEDAMSRGYTVVWKSLEVPPRPPMLPGFGNIQTWNFDLDEKIRMRTVAGAPPKPDSKEFQQALDELKNIAQNRTREQVRIASLWADGAGTYTPPGHWNRRASQAAYANKYSDLRTARMLALLNTAMHDAAVCCWDMKYYYMLPRPTQIDPAATTSTGIPNFPSYASGHSTFSAAAAEVLSSVFPDQRANFEAWANEAALSRIYGGIHYRFDSDNALVHGKMIGSHAVARGKNDNSGL